MELVRQNCEPQAGTENCTELRAECEPSNQIAVLRNTDLTRTDISTNLHSEELRGALGKKSESSGSINPATQFKENSAVLRTKKTIASANGHCKTAMSLLP